MSAGEETLLTVNALFAAMVRERADAVGVQDGDRALSYRALGAAAAALAHGLTERGVRKGDAVVVYADRTAETVVAMLGVMRAGGAFVPVALETPPARLELILRDARARLLLADRAGRERLAGRESDLGAVAIDAAARRPAAAVAGGHEGEEGAAAPVTGIGPGDLAYVIYTSGTTGEPKGVMIEHGAIARRFHDWDRVFSLSGSAYRCLQMARLGFDVFVGDVVKALCSGGVLVIYPSSPVLDPPRLVRWLVDEAIDYFDTVPAVLSALVDHLETSRQDLASLGIINCGADLWTRADYERARSVTRVPRLFNGYGITECAVESTLFEDDGVTLARKSTLPIGRALASDKILVVDQRLEPVAPGLPGQICIGGPCLARGYVGRPELDAQAFFLREERPGELVRYYKTGDLGRVEPDGVFEFLGRMDSQVKIHGQRIELEEIERALEQCAAVQQAVVCVDGERRELVAYVRVVAGKALDESACRAELRLRLPSSMVPRNVVAVRSFPLTQNGKIDRSALAAGASRRRRPHDLHRSVDLADLSRRLRQRDIDVMSVVREFVKPAARFGVLVGGSIAQGTATEMSDLDLVVLLDGLDAMKRRRREVCGEVVDYLPAAGGREVEVSLSLDGIEIDVHLLADAGASGEPAAVAWRQTLASRLASDWIVHGHDVVERWRGRLR